MCNYIKFDNVPCLYRRRPLSEISGGIQSTTDFAVLRTADFDKSKALNFIIKRISVKLKSFYKKVVSF